MQRQYFQLQFYTTLIQPHDKRAGVPMMRRRNRCEKKKRSIKIKAQEKFLLYP